VNPAPFIAMLEAEPLAFPSVISIETPSVSRDSEGGEIDGARTVRHADIPCQFDDAGTFTDEDRLITGTFEDTLRSAFLLRDWPDIELTDVLVHDNEVWDIRSIGRDGWEIVTRLEIEKRNP
jgi:hypothetical protein